MRPVGLAILAAFIFVQNAVAVYSCTGASNHALSATSLTTTITISSSDMVFVTTAVNVSGSGCAGQTQTISSPSNTWGSALDSGQPNTFICVTDWYIVGATADINVKVTISPGANLSMSVIRCSGVATSAALDGHSTGTTNATTSPVTTSGSIGASGDLVIGGAGAYDNVTWSAGTGGGVTMTIPSGGTGTGGSAGAMTSTVEYATATGAGTVGVAYTGAAGDGQAILGAAFLAASAATGTLTPTHSGVF